MLSKHNISTIYVYMRTQPFSNLKHSIFTFGNKHAEKSHFRKTNQITNSVNHVNIK